MVMHDGGADTFHFANPKGEKRLMTLKNSNFSKPLQSYYSTHEDEIVQSFHSYAVMYSYLRPILGLLVQHAGCTRIVNILGLSLINSQFYPVP